MSVSIYSPEDNYFTIIQSIYVQLGEAYDETTIVKWYVDLDDDDMYVGCDELCVVRLERYEG